MGGLCGPRAVRLSVVVVSLNEGPRLRATVERLQATLPDAAEIVVVDDGSSDRSSDFLRGQPGPVRLIRASGLGVAQARNYGARHTRGDVIIFVDAHVWVPEHWWIAFVEALADPVVAAVAPAVSVEGAPEHVGFGACFSGPDLEIEWLPRPERSPHRAAILPGCCLAMRREVFETTGGFDDGMLRSGGVDNEFGVRLWSLGYELRVVPEVEVTHFFREEHPYPLEWRTVIHNKLRLALVHFSPPRITHVVETLRDSEGFPDGVALIVGSDVADRRRRIAARRTRDDAWFFKTLSPAW
jgi:GT2 family glycosyltransferase